MKLLRRIGIALSIIMVVLLIPFLQTMAQPAVLNVDLSTLSAATCDGTTLNGLPVKGITNGCAVLIAGTYGTFSIANDGPACATVTADCARVEFVETGDASTGVERLSMVDVDLTMLTNANTLDLIEIERTSAISRTLGGAANNEIGSAHIVSGIVKASSATGRAGVGFSAFGQVGTATEDAYADNPRNTSLASRQSQKSILNPPDNELLTGNASGSTQSAAVTNRAVFRANGLLSGDFVLNVEQTVQSGFFPPFAGGGCTTDADYGNIIIPAGSTEGQICVPSETPGAFHFTFGPNALRTIKNDLSCPEKLEARCVRESTP